MLEYPQIITEKVQCLTRLQRLENKSLEKSDIIITHDKWHKQFLLTHFNLNNKILLLPNSSFTPEIYMESNFLQKRLGVQGQKIVLHSGDLVNGLNVKNLQILPIIGIRMLSWFFMLVTELKMINILRKSMSLIIEEKSCFL